MTPDEAKRILLETLLDGPKVFHMGRCPMDAITLGFEMSQEGLVKITDRDISITAAGRQFLEKK